MKKKKLLIGTILLSLTFTYATVFADSKKGDSDNLKVKKVTTQIIVLPNDANNELINAYIGSGWIYNKEKNQVQRDVSLTLTHFVRQSKLVIY